MRKLTAYMSGLCFFLAGFTGAVAVCYHFPIVNFDYSIIFASVGLLIIGILVIKVRK